MKRIYFYFMALIISGSVVAQMPTITSTDNAVAFQKLQIDVKIVGNIASSTWTMTFVNNANRIMEGNLTFPLGEGIAVDNYAIDINGKMRKAVPVEKAKATTVFEDISRRRVDPGILEKIEGNSFRTRVYPIAARGGTRTVSIGFNEELSVENNLLKMNIPLAFTKQFNEFIINVSVIENALPPTIVSSEQLVFDKVEQSYNLSKTYQNYIPNKPLTIIVPKKQDTPEVTVQKIGNNYFFLANVMVKGQQRLKPAPNHITILWDQSLSAENRNLDKELELLDAYFKSLRQATVRLIGFSNNIIEDKNYTIVGGEWEALKNNLKTTIYDGATNYSALDLKQYKTDEFLLFSDGLANFIGEEMKLTNTAVYSIASNPKSDYAALKKIAIKSKGEFINLNVLNTNQAINILNYQVYKFLGVKVQPGYGTETSVLVRNSNEFYPSIPTIVSGNFLLSGRVNSLYPQVVLQFGFNNQVVEERIINITDSPTNKIEIDRIWAAKKINELDLDYDKNKKKIESLGKKYGIVTRNTSLMVLEEVQDYIRYNIDPPAELLDEYNRLKGRTPNNREDFEQSTFNLDYLLDRLDKWYNWKKIVPARSNGNTVKQSAMMDLEMIAADEMVVQEEAMMLSEVVAASPSASKEVAVSAVSAGLSKSVAEEKEQNKQSETSGSTTAFRAHIAGDETYIIEIEKAKDSYGAYLKCRKKYKTSTKFYFNVAQSFADRKEMELAIRVLSNIAELDQENYELYKGLGYKLKAMGQYHAASYVFKKVLDWRPMEPQSYRDYGLSLADEGKLQEGLDVLTEGLTRKYATNIPEIFNGVQEIFFTDINGLVGKNPKLKVDKRIKQYIKLVDADVRVILSWNLGDSYIDLHITDPNNEQCDYRNMTTSTGGQFSTDFAGGYGPREFIQRKAVKGEYKIQTNYYGDNIQRIAGPAMVMVEVYKNFGTPKESRTVIALHPSTKQGNMFDIGELVWY